MIGFTFGEILMKIWQHLYIFFISWFFAAVIGILIGIFVTRPGRQRLGKYIIGITGGIQSVPSIAVIAIVFIYIGIGAAPAILSLFLYSLVPVVFNTASALSSIPNSLIETAKGMGMNDKQILKKVEIPLSIPVTLAGLRNAAIINIGTTTVASAIGAGGLGEIIFVGLSLYDSLIIFVGAFLVAVIAVGVDSLIGFIGGKFVSEGIKQD